MDNLTSIVQLLQSSPILFTALCSIVSLMAGSLDSDITHKQISLY